MASRIQLRRVKGWRLPVDAVNCSRPSKWGNPHIVRGLTVHHPDGTTTDAPTIYDAHRIAVEAHHSDLWAGRLTVTVGDVRAELAGLDLACSCRSDLPCHVDTYLTITDEAPT